MKSIKLILNVISWIFFITFGILGLSIIGGLIIGLTKAWYEN